MPVETKMLQFDREDGKGNRVPIGTLALGATRVVVCSQYAELHDEKDEYFAVVTWKSTARMRVISPNG